MSRLGLLFLLALPSLAGARGFSERPAKYDASLFELATAYSAKEVCSCVFVLGRDEDFCREVTRVSPDVVTFRVDREAQRVTSRALLFWRAQASYRGAREGCALDR